MIMVTTCEQQRCSAFSGGTRAVRAAVSAPRLHLALHHSASSSVLNYTCSDAVVELAGDWRRKRDFKAHSQRRMGFRERTIERSNAERVISAPCPDSRTSLNL